MHFRKLTLGLAGAAIGLAGAASSAMAADPQFVPNLVYKTGPYAPSGTPVAHGFMDYFNMKNVVADTEMRKSLGTPSSDGTPGA